MNENSYWNIIIPAGISLSIIAYFFFLVDFLEKRILWSLLVLGLFVYVVFFVAYDYFLKEKEIDEKLRIKDTSEIRISFWN